MSEKTASRGRVVVVDDDAAQRRLMQIKLEEEGFDVVTYSTGEECLRMAAAFDPDVFLLDIDMPGMDGIETCRQLKNAPDLAPIPVVFVTGHRDDDPTTVQALRAGGNDFISKDASQIVLLTRVSCQVTINRAQRSLRRMAMTDELTGLFSRRFLFDSLRRAVKSSNRQGPGGVVCLLIDLDHFKKINDTLGHLQGDECLRSIAIALKECTRESDIVGRFGGEEFVVILPDTDEAGGKYVAERIRENVQKRCPTTVSIGASIIEPLTLEILKKDRALDDVVLKLIHQADVAMYASKAAGRNRVTLWNEKLEVKAKS